MKPKYSYIFTLLLSILVLFGGGFVYNSLLKKAIHDKNLRDAYITDSYVDYKTQLSDKSYKPRRTPPANENNSVFPEVNDQSSKQTGVTPEGYPGHTWQTQPEFLNKKKESKNQMLSDNQAGSSVLAYRSRNGVLGSAEPSTSSSGFQSVTSIAPPSSAPRDPYDNSTVLVDPSADPDPEYRIPVSDGLFFVVLITFVYAAMRRIKR